VIAGVVLAAGFGTRMGSPKALLSIDGEPALGRIVRRFLTAGIHRPVVVLGHRHEDIEAQLDLVDCRVVVNPDPSRGLSSSVRLGLASIEPSATGALVVPVDMPAISVATIRAVYAAGRTGARIAAPVFGGRRGFPVYLARSCFAELERSLSGDRGARDYLVAHPADLVTVEVDDPGCVLDIDTPEDLERLRACERRVPCDTSA